MRALDTKSVLDTGHLAQQTLGDAALEQEVLALFENECRRLAPTIGGADGPARREAAHALRGAALAIGAFRLADVTARIEEEASSVRDPGAALERAVQEVMAAIARRRSVTAAD